jgi:hypothetical protein
MTGKPTVFAMISHQQNPHIAYPADATAAAVVIGSWTDRLPAIAAGLSIIYILIQIYQSGFFQQLFTWLRSKLSRVPPR